MFGRLLCLLGLHYWCVDIPVHAVAALRSGRVVEHCPRCDAWRPARY